MTDKLPITIKIDGSTFPLKVDRDQEEKYRKAAKLTNDIILQYRQRYSSNNSLNFSNMAAFYFALKTIELEEKVDQTPLFDELKKLDEELSDYLSL